jgi:hypothetical protein
LGQIVAGFKKKENLCHGNKQRAMTMPKWSFCYVLD